MTPHLRALTSALALAALCACGADGSGPAPGASAPIGPVSVAGATSVPGTIPQAPPSAVPVTTAHPILFVTQIPIPDDFRTIGSAFGNHMADPARCGRGGDLYIRYPDGVLRNLTREAGFGAPGEFQGANSIAVRQPCAHWSGTKAVFSMVVGAPTQQGQGGPWFWQLYEVSGLGKGQTAVITKVASQPSNSNNISPIYASDDRILFTSDRPRNGAPHLYPQLDEYEMAPSTTGLWSLDPQSGELFLVQHSPSGSFTPFVASSGRVMFSRWDHLERDQQADLERQGSNKFRTWNWSDESPASVPTTSNEEVFPEPRIGWISFINSTPGYTGPLAGYAPHLVGNSFNKFTLWQVNQDGTEEETVIHLGRHELNDGVPPSRNDDPAIVPHDLASAAYIANKLPIHSIYQPREDPLQAGAYLAVDAHEHRAHASGQLILLRAPDMSNPDATTIEYLTPRSTYDDVPAPDHSGHYRSPLPLADGQWISVHTPQIPWDTNLGTPAFPQALYDFRLVELVHTGTWWTAGKRLTAGLDRRVRYWNPNLLVTYDGELWELDPVEVVARTPPVPPVPTLDQPELQALNEAHVTVAQLVAWLESQDLALIVSRNVTSRDFNDRQQPFNLRVPGGGAQTIGSPGDSVYDVAHMQLFQADQLRAIDVNGVPVTGRRVLAEPMHDAAALAHNVPNPGGPPGSVKLGPDGSMAALVPARRALSWHTTDGAGEPVVRERYWLTFQPGEIRTCTVCHGINSQNQEGALPPGNQPLALRNLLQHLKATGQL